MNITDEKLKAAIQIALGKHGVYTEKIESDLIHHLKALTINIVDNRRELLAKYTKWQGEYYSREEHMYRDIDRFLNS